MDKQEGSEFSAQRELKEALAEGQEARDPWQHRSAGMRCRTCMFYVSKAGAEVGVELGRCRRHAPTMGGYPVVMPHDWCGDHKLDETKVARGV